MLGTTVSHYTILEKLGEGGMGVVYKAHDTTLDRDVALKFLAHSLKVSQTDQARFLQEARSAALLNHPNICTIHDVLELDDETQGGKQSVIVMEFVDGKSLRDMLPIGSMKQATEIGIQIASGLAAAHEKGLVHRDVKPENIMVFKGGGRAVIMDFGLAKLKGSLSLTRTGTTVGTVKYMSPEQICGGEVDHRSDIFSLGVVLYELFTGHSPFKGEHEAAVLYEIANGEPPLPSTYKPEIPKEIEALILECLAKDANERIQSAAEVRRRLSAASGPSRTVAKTVAVQTGRTPSIDDNSKAAGRKLFSLRSVPLLWALVALFAVAFLAVGVLYMSRPSTGLDLSSVKVTPVAGEPENEDLGVFSPDGRSIAYTKSFGLRRQLMVKNLDPNALPTLLTVGMDPEVPFWSATGELIYFVHYTRLMSIGAAGGDPRPVFESLPVQTAALSPDGNTLLLWAQTTPVSEANNSSRDSVWSLFLSSPPGAPPRKLTPSPYEMGATQPVYVRISPDGSTAALSKFIPTKERADFWLVPLVGTKDAAPQEVLWQQEFPYPVEFGWLADSRTVVLSSQGILWFGDTRTGHLCRLSVAAPGAWNPNVSRDGKKILFSTGIGGDFYNPHVAIVDLPLDGSPPRLLIGSSFSEHSPSWSASGERMAYVTTRSGKDAIWIRTPKEDLRAVVTTEQFTEDETISLANPAISPDGMRVAYLRRGVKSGGWQYFVSPTEGGRPTPLGIRSLSATALTWSPDSKQFATMIMRPASRTWLVLKTVGSQDSARVLSREMKLSTAPTWSPKGDWIACGIQRDSILLISPDGKKSRKLKSPVSTSNPRIASCSLAWKEDGTMLYIVSSTEEGSRLDVLDIATGRNAKLAGYDGSVDFSGPWLWGITSSLGPGRKCLTTTVSNVKCDLWVMEGFPDPAALW